MLVLGACSGGGGAAPTPWPGYINDGIGMDYSAARAAQLRLNIYRALAGVPAVELDYTLSRGCQLHANYLVLNGIDLSTVGLGAHDEDSTRTGFTVAGTLAAKNSIIFQGVTPVEAVDKWFQTLYHRIGLLDPNLQRIGFGTNSGFQVLDMRQGRAHGSDMVTATVLYPAPGTSNVPGAFKIEIPHPIPGDQSLGIPVTAEFCGPAGFVITGVETQLLNLDTAQEVPCYLQVPGDPFLPEWNYSNVIALLPQDPLPSGRYMASMQAFVDDGQWSAEWSFSVR